MHKIIEHILKNIILLLSYLTILAFPVLTFAEPNSIVKPSPVDAFSMMGVLNMVMGLVVVIALILGLAWVLKKYSKLPGANQVDMKILGGLSLGTREKAILIEVENTRVLVGVTPGHIQTLHVFNEASSLSANPPDVSLPESSADSFQSKLNNELEIDK